MKKSIYSLFILGFIISSCGTSNQYASSQYDDAIYNITSERVIALNTATDESLRSLVKKTQEAEKAIVNGREAKIVYVNEKGVADIVVENENTYLILDSTMSYEERLRKFDSPDYNINIYISDRWGWDSDRYYDPFWYMSRNPFAFRHMAFGHRPYYRSSFFFDWWSSPYYGWYGGYYDPWNFGYAGYYNPYYWNSRYYGGYYGYYNGYYGHGNHGWYNNWYNGGGGNSGGNYNGGSSSGQSRYNGKRVANYRTDGDNNNTGTSRSVVRRNPSIEQIGGTRVTPTQNREGSAYRRDNKTGSSGVRYNNEVVTPTRDNRSSGQTERTGTTYRRNEGNERGTVSSTNRTSSERGNSSASQSGSTYRKSSSPGSSYSRESGSSRSGSASVNSSQGSGRSSSSSSTSSYVRSSSGGANISSGSSSSGSTSSSSGSSSGSSSSSGSTYRR